MELLSILTSVFLCIAIPTLVLHFLNIFYFTTSSISRQLRKQGVHVLPFHILSNAPLFIRMEQLAVLPDLPSAPPSHNIVARLHPFYCHIFSQCSARTFVYWWGTQPRLVLTNPEDVKHVFTADVKSFSKSRVIRRVFGRLFGEGLFLAEGQDWHNRRSILRPAFFPEKLKGMVADMQCAATQMVEAWSNIVKESIGQSAEVEVGHHLKNVTADILARTCFGSDYEGGKGVFQKQEVLLRRVLEDGLLNSLIPGYKFIPTPFNVKSWELERGIHKVLSGIVKSRTKSLAEGGGAHVSRQTDLLGLVLAGDEDDKTKKVALTVNQIMDECKTFFFAGQETTANLLTWTMMLLALSQEWQVKAREEVMEVYGSTKGQLDADHFNKMRLLGMVLNESLRLYPPVTELTPRASILNDNFKLGHLVLPRGMAFAIPALCIHRDKELWGDDADEFRPQRFQEGVSKACKHPFGFLPFGVGPRICIGQSFALLEAKVIMSAILQRFKFRLSPNYRHAPETMVTMRPRHGMQIILESL